jgi:ABC-type amino acid transport substrate-binding protein
MMHCHSKVTSLFTILSVSVAIVMGVGGFQSSFADLEGVRQRGVLRHLGVRYARFITGSGDGLSADLAKGFAADLGVDYHYVETSWETVISDLTGKTYRRADDRLEITGDCDIKGDIIANGLTILPWRRQLINYSTPTFPSGIWLIARSDAPIQPIAPSGDILSDIAAVKALLRNRSVLCMPGTCLDPVLYDLGQTGARLIPLPLQMNEFAPAVINRTAETSLLDVADAMIAMEKWPGMIKVVGPISEHQEMGFGFAKTDVELLKRFNRYLAQLRSDGRYQQLVDRYYPGVRVYFEPFFRHYERSD